jgi:hypothetical protein
LGFRRQSGARKGGMDEGRKERKSWNGRVLSFHN